MSKKILKKGMFAFLMKPFTGTSMCTFQFLVFIFIMHYFAIVFCGHSKRQNQTMLCNTKQNRRPLCYPAEICNYIIQRFVHLEAPVNKFHPKREHVTLVFSLCSCIQSAVRDYTSVGLWHMNVFFVLFLRLWLKITI